jgi:hypothetical protein
MKALVQIPDVGINRVGVRTRCAFRKDAGTCPLLHGAQTEVELSSDFGLARSAVGQSFISSYRLYRLCLFCCLADEVELGSGGGAEAMNPCMLPWAACFNESGPEQSIGRSITASANCPKAALRKKGQFIAFTSGSLNPKARINGCALKELGSLSSS